MPSYKKGNQDITNKITVDYPVAVQNGAKTLHKLIGEDLPTLEDTDE